MRKVERQYARLIWSNGIALEPPDRASTSPLPMSDDASSRRVEIRPNFRSRHSSIDGSLAGDHPLGRDATSKEPHRNLRLPNGLSDDRRELVGERRLTTGDFDQSLNGGRNSFLKGHRDPACGGVHSAFNTVGVIAVNTRSVLERGQTERMPRNGVISDFWQRLAQARMSCTPPKSMKQEDIAGEYGVFQSSVTKWSTGKSKPKPAVIEKMALDTNVNVNWLWNNQGDMRPLPATDPIIRRIVAVANGLSDEARLKVFEEALLQQNAQQSPAVAAQLREARDAAAEKKTADLPRRRARRT